MISKPTIEVVGFPAALGECPLWHDEQQQLFWVDIDGRSVHRWDPSTGTSSLRNLPGRPGSVAFTPDPDVLLVAMENELCWLHWPSG
ncbi:MAG: SMP-30/gluconolactonase/LRE family protein, partial [Acidimicrobiia bacterium]|nr:SMP-30/gluconolactonase/LRE family protein [Acidimicrobiia bacterium]